MIRSRFTQSLRLRSGQVKLLVLIGITLLGAFLRLYRIDSLPPGDGYDPANYGLDALAILEGARPIFLPTNFGREALFSYLVAVSFLVLGAGPRAIFATSAVVGTLTIPAVYLVAEEMFSAESGALARFGGLLAALTVAISYWDLNWSRLGVRAILVPLFASLTFYFLWRGLRTGRRWAFVACGVSLGFSMYTYQAARLLPLLVLLGFMYVARVRNQASPRKPGFHLMNLVLVFALALIVFAPLGYYFLTHPGSFTQRIEQTLVVSPSQEPRSNVRILFDQLATTLLVFNFHGDEEPRANIPGRPALNPFLSVAFFLGIGISLWRIKKPRYLFLLAWLGVMILPAILAQYGPTTKRAIGVTPAMAMLIAIGALAPWDGLRRWAIRHPSPWPKALTAALAIAIGTGFVYSGIQTYRDYFLVWGQNPDLFTHFEAGYAAIGKYVKGLPPQEQIYLSPVVAEHHSIVLNSERRPGVKSYNGRVCLVLPERAAHDTTYVIVDRDDKNSLDLLHEYFPQGRIVAQGPLHYQKPYFLVYRVPAGAEARVVPSHQLEANWGNKIQLLGYDLDAAALRQAQDAAYEAGETIHLTLYFRGLSRMQTGYTVFTHLLGPHNPATGGPLWGQDDSEPCRRFYPTTVWDVGEIVRDEYAIPIPAETPPGEYQLEIGFYNWRTLERLPVLNAAGQVVADQVILGQVRITAHE